jgi:hypothetical protein
VQPTNCSLTTVFVGPHARLRLKCSYQKSIWRELPWYVCATLA